MRLFLITAPNFAPITGLLSGSWMRPVSTWSGSEKWCVVGHVYEWWVIPCYGSLLMLTPHRRNNRHHLHEAKQVGRIMNCNCNVFRIPLSEQKFEKVVKLTNYWWPVEMDMYRSVSCIQYTKLSSDIITWY